MWQSRILHILSLIHIYNYFVKRGNVLNLGYSKEEQNQFRLKFYKKRKYYFKDAYAVTIPISEYANRINKLKENTLENVKMDTNLITCLLYTSMCMRML